MTRTLTWSLNYYDPQRVKESLSASCHLEIRNNAPVLTSRFGDAMELREWGIAIGGSMVNDKPDSFNILSARGRLRHTWTWSRKKDKPDIISVEYVDGAHPDETARMTILFAEDTSASTWFMWLRKYATQTATGFFRRPQTCPVLITRTVHSWWQKTPHAIQRRRSIDCQWKNLMSGYSQNSRIREGYFTYVRNDMIGFVSVRHSGVTLVDERFSRADNPEPAITRRYHFKTEAEAGAWYNAWKDIATAQKGKTAPVPLTRLHVRYGVLLQVSDRRPVLNAALWPEKPLKDFGIQKSKPPISRAPGISFTVASGASKWTWERKGTQLTIYTKKTSLHGWFQCHRLNFTDSKSCKDWFSYLDNYASGGMPSFSPPAEYPPPAFIIFTDEAAVWMQQEQEHGRIQTREGTEESWTNMFGECKNYELNKSYLAITDTSNKTLPHIRISQNGCDLVQKRMASVNNRQDIHIPLITTYRFPTADDARKWYMAWKANIKQNLL